MRVRVLFKGIASLIVTSVMIGCFPLVSTVNAATPGIILSGSCHIQDMGDALGTWDDSSGTLTLGTEGQSKRLESFNISLDNQTGLSGDLEYRSHVQDIGWQEYIASGNMSGTYGQGLRIEGIEMRLTGELADYYTVEYQAHIQDYGNSQGFVSDGITAGTTGQSRRIEELQVRIVPRCAGTATGVEYHVHIQDVGWETDWKSDGEVSGSVGQSKRLEAIEIFLTGNQYSGGIIYHTHIQDMGWESVWSGDGSASGTSGQSKRLEGIEIALTGDVSAYYDVYYRVHAQDFGWLGWAKNGEMAGTEGLSKRLEAIQIVLVAKGAAAPGDISGINSVRTEAGVINTDPAVAEAEAQAAATSEASVNPYPWVDEFAQGFGSDTAFLILVDRSLCMVFIYEGSQYNWTLIKFCSCCVGKPSTPTITGQYKIKGKGTYFDTHDGGRCWYFSIIQGNYYFHSVIYDKSPAPVNIKDGTMGQQVSHGCIRLSVDDAWWIYNYMPKGTTVYIFN